MACVTCSGLTQDNPWGAWCDVCGGVSYKPGQLFIRHVATVDGKGGRFPIVYDLSTSDYAFMHKDPNPNAGEVDFDGFHRPPVQVSHGSLNAVISVSYPDARGGEGEVEISAAPSATPEEKAIVLMEF